MHKKAYKTAKDTFAYLTLQNTFILLLNVINGLANYHRKFTKPSLYGI